LKKNDKNLVRGKFMLKGNIGFVAPLDETVEDVFIPQEGINEAMNGDIVDVYVSRRNGRTFGTVEKISERRHSEVTGLIDLRRREYVLVTKQATYPIKLQIDKKRFRDEIISPGFYATAEILEFPTAYAAGVGRLVNIIGKAGDPAVEIEAAKASWGIGAEFPKDVIKEAKHIPDRITPDDLNDRLDLRNLKIFTIDPTDARDFDDALSIRTVNQKGAVVYEIGVHISDVSHYVKAGSILDREAYKRGTSVYLPGKVIPMLPEKLSNGVCSLVEGADRLAISVLIELDRNFVPVRHKFARTVILSRRRFTYEEADEILSSGSGDFAEELGLFKKIAEKRFAERLARGAVDLELPEDKPILDLEGRVIDMHQIERTWSHRLVEEMMLLANELTARAMKERGIFRVHEDPAPEKIVEFRRLSSFLGGPSKGSVQTIIEFFRGKPYQRLIEFSALRSMQEARYSANNLGHYGLALSAYTHFTSPIRRYPDLIVHRILMGERVGSLNEVARHSSMKEREAMEAEREALQIRYLEYAAKKLGETAKGFVDYIAKDGLYIQLESGPRGFLPSNELGTEKFFYDKRSAALVGARSGRTIRIGMELETIISSVDISSRRLYLSPVEKSVNKIQGIMKRRNKNEFRKIHHRRRRR